MLGFQRLDVYRHAIRFLALATRMVDDLPQGYASLTDQFRHGAISIPLSIAEAAGQKDPSSLYECARSAAFECAAILDTLDSCAVVDPARKNDADELLAKIVELLTKRCR